VLAGGTLKLELQRNHRAFLGASNGHERRIAMKRNRWLAMVLGMLALLIVLVIHGSWSAVRADLPQSTATQIFQPSFEEWAFVYLTACYRDYSSQTHFVSVGRQSINGRERFMIVGSYSKNPQGQAWFDRIGSQIRKAVEADCKRWTAEGFPISLNDFQIDISPVVEKPAEKPQ
jgi:hypothetical protein